MCIKNISTVEKVVNGSFVVYVKKCFLLLPRAACDTGAVILSVGVWLVLRGGAGGSIQPIGVPCRVVKDTLPTDVLE